MKPYMTLFFLLALSLPIGAQQVSLISRDEILSRARENNASLKIAQQDVLSAQADYRQTNVVLLPNIGVTHTGIATTNPLLAFGSKLNQAILTPGDFDPALLNDPRQIEDYATRIQVQQPLINLDGLFQRKAARAKLSATTLQSERTRQHLELQLDKAYMELQLAYKTVEVLEKTREAAQENLRIARSSFAQGYLQKSDVLAVEVRLNEIENRLQYAKSNILNASNQLSVLMGDPNYDLYRPSDSLTIRSREAFEPVFSENRADIQAMVSASNAYEQMHRADLMSFLPRLNAFGTYELHDDQVFQGAADGYFFGAELSWNILEGSQRFGKAQKSKAQYERSRLELEQYRAQSQVELNRANRMLQDARNNLELSSLSLEQARESLRIRSNRFEQGLEKTTDLLFAEAQYAQKQLEYYSTVYRHNYAQAYVHFLTLE